MKTIENKTPKTKQSAKDFIKNIRTFREETEATLRVNGVELNLSEWVTIKKYCELFNIENTALVSTWISRGVVPEDNVVTIEELNGLKLIKAVPYR